MSDTIVRIIFLQAAIGAGLIALMLVLRRLLFGKVPHRLIYGLWLVVALRMLIPLELPNPIRPDHQANIPIHQTYIMEQPDVKSGTHEVPSQSGESNVANPVNSTQDIHESEKNTPQTPPAAARADSTKPLSTAQYLAALWICGVVLTAGYMVLVNRRFHRRIFAQAAVLSVESPIPVLMADIPSPCLVGVLKPRIVLNETGARPENIPFAMMHELCHYRGWDHIWNFLRNVLIVLFWFHPLVWIAAHCSKKDCERACDERVTRTLNADNSIEYARTLISLVSPRKAAFSASASFMATSLPDMKERVTLIITRKRIQRWACALFTGIILLSSVVSFATGEAAISEIKLPEHYEEIPLFYPSSDGLWVAMNGRLYRQNGEETFAEVAPAPSASQIAVDDEAVYVLEAEQRQIIALDFQGNQQKAWSLPEELTPFKIEVAGDKLALLSGQPADLAYGRVTAEAKLYLLNKLDNSLTEAKLGTVMDVCADRKGGLLVLHTPMPGMTSALISRMSLRDLSTAVVTETGIQSQGIAADTGVCYILGHGTLTKYDEQAKTSTEILMEGERILDVLRDMRAWNGLLYAWNAATGQLVTIDVSENRSAGKTVLAFINRGGYVAAFDSAKAAFLARHPDVELRDIQMGYEQYTTALLAGDTEMDVLFEGSGLIGRFAEAGALLPLDDQPSIVDALSKAEWMPFEEIYSYAGKLYGIPSYVMYSLWAVDEDLARQTGFTMPTYPFTWLDVYQAAESAGLGQPGKPILMYDYIGNPDVMYNYTMTQAQKQGALQYDTPAFREDMEAYRQMVMHGIIIVDDFGEDARNTPAIVTTTFGDIGDHTVPTPTVNGLEVAMMQSYGFCINSRSPNRDLAIEFLAEYARPEHQYMADYGIVDTMLLKDSTLYRRDHYDDPTWEIQRYTQKMEDLRQFTAGKWVTWNTKLHSVNILEQTDALPRYLEGSITIDEFIRIIQSKADMMQYE